ncbi:MAG: ATPase [Treponema sp.]|nr:ATPase [Treponema sp.]
MIEPMKKVSVVIINKEKEEALKALRKIGLVHLQKLEGSSEKLNAFKEYTNNAVVSESILGEIKLPKKSKKQKAILEDSKVIKLCSEVVAKSERRKQLLEEISADTTELDRFTAWGSVSLEDFDYLKEKGIILRLYEISADKYSQIDSEIETILLNNDKKNVRFLVVGHETRPEKLLPQAFEVPFPRMSTDALEEEIKKDEKEIKDIEKFYQENARYVPAIVAFRKNLETDIEFENVNAGMEHENTDSENELAWISGYVPVADMEEFKKACASNQWAMACADPEEEDIEVPTKLRNNKFVSLIYPLTDFLGTVPGYHEYDISGWFLLFFTIFFGMIFGDGGYGLLVTVIGLLMILKAIFTGKKPAPLLGLVTLVGFATILWGLVTCTWFGLKPEQLPQWLVNLSIPQISNASDKLWTPFWKPDATEGLTTAQNLQIFCFTLALLQLSVAHIKAMIRNRKSLKILGDFGALLQLIGMYWVVLSMVVSSSIFSFTEKIYGFPIGLFEISLVGIGFVLSFIFSNYEGSIGKSVLESCKNIISVLLGVVNVFSDIVSYIRLWAVGLAGAAISNTVNEMAGPMWGHAIMFIAFVALLAFGHGLNMILNLLSVIVHGVRLNTLEFSSHLGMSWSGLKYSPFKEKDAK